MGYVSPSSTSILPFCAPHNCDILLAHQTEQWSTHKICLEKCNFMWPEADKYVLHWRCMWTQ
jgi:hypothetical protein